MSTDTAVVTEAFTRYKAYVEELCAQGTNPARLAEQMGRTIDRVGELLEYYDEWSADEQTTFLQHLEFRAPDSMATLQPVLCFGAMTSLSRSIRQTLEAKGIVLVDRFLSEGSDFRPL